MPSRDHHDRQRSSFGGIIIRFETVDSTNDVALRVGKQGLPEGSVVQARTQRLGRGRKGNDGSLLQAASISQSYFNQRDAVLSL